MERWFRVRCGRCVLRPVERARETWQLMTGELDTSPRVTAEERIYGAAGAAGAALPDLVRQTPQAVSTLLVVGHDPGVPDLAGGYAGAAITARCSGCRPSFLLARSRSWPYRVPGGILIPAAPG